MTGVVKPSDWCVLAIANSEGVHVFDYSVQPTFMLISLRIVQYAVQDIHQVHVGCSPVLTQFPLPVLVSALLCIACI